MKVNIIPEEDTFRPFDFLITVQSEREVQLLYHLFNRSIEQINKSIQNNEDGTFRAEYEESRIVYMLFNKIYRVMIQRGIKA
jgi:hypothetical protein